MLRRQAAAPASFRSRLLALLAWPVLLLVLLVLSRCCLSPADGTSYLCWWLSLLLPGLMAWPLAVWLLRPLPLRYAYWPAKALGLLLLALIHWQCGYLLHLGLTGRSIIILMLLSATLIWGLALHHGFALRLTGCKAALISQAAAMEGLFALILLAGAVIRATKPSLDSLEKFMNTAFINSILRSPGLPAPDPWLSGSSINYYYFGHYTYALLIRLSHQATPVACNLAMATLPAFGICLSALIGASLVRLSQPAGQQNTWHNRLWQTAGGLLSLFTVNLAGNGHAFFYSDQGPGKKILAWLQAQGVTTGDLQHPYWFAEATRFIGYNPDTHDKTIHEFPYYSYLVADLHAHVMDLTVVLLFFLLLLCVFIQIRQAARPTGIPFLGVLLAIAMMTNYWDFVIDLAVTLIVLLLAHAPAVAGGRNARLKALRLVAFQLLAILAIIWILTWPFQSHFAPMSSRLAPAPAHSAPLQLAVLWGAPVLACCIGLAVLLIYKRRCQRRLQPTDSLAAGLLLGGILLILMPEWLYVVDIYSGDYKRANTMFKLTYQAFVMLGLAWGYLLARVASLPSRRRLAAVLMAALLVIPGWYTVPALRQWYDKITPGPVQGLDGLAPLGHKDSAEVAGNAADELQDDLLAITWFNQQVRGQPVILEAAGASYTDFARISTFTGLPTLIGWETHEWLWRTSARQPDAYQALVRPRQEAVETLYTTADQDTRQRLLRQYQVSYVVIGAIERTRYGQNLREDLLFACGEPVFTSPTLTLIKVSPAEG
jgi:uncharacterized membrane protein